MKRILAAAVALLALMTALASCNSAGGEADLGQTEPLPPLAEGGVANFTIVRSDLATSEQARPAVLVREALESVTGAKFAIKTDWEKPGKDNSFGFIQFFSSLPQGVQKRFLETLSKEDLHNFIQLMQMHQEHLNQQLQAQFHL